MTVEFTPAAVQRLQGVMSEQDMPTGTALRLSVRGGGCAGFEYQMDFTDKVEDHDKVFQFEAPGDAPGDGGAGLRVAIDPKSYLYLNGVTVDFSNSVMDSKFVFDNPNANRSCGCGTSFDV